MPQVLSVTCNHCGAPLRVPGDVRFLTCIYCNSQLEVHTANGAAYTQVLNAIDQRTQQIAADVAEIKSRERLEQIDREWMMQRQSYMVRNKRGMESVPNSAGAIFGSVIAAVFGIIWIGFAASIGAPFFFPLFGVVFVIAAIVGGISAATKSAEYSNAEAEYQRERSRMLREIESARKD